MLGPRPSLLDNLDENLILFTDGYKASHFRMLPQDISAMHSYIESRGGKFSGTLFYGLQMELLRRFTKPITRHHIRQAAYVSAISGMPFNEAGWEHIYHRYAGYLPLSISSVAEGSIVPTSNALVTVDVDQNDRDIAWLCTYFEAPILRSCWYGSTIATLSYATKLMIRDYMMETCDDLSGLNTKLHDFGARGASSGETAQMGGSAHLINFWGSDTVEGAVAAMMYYDCDVPFRTIAAAEHSTITIWGRDGEVDAYRNILNQYATPGAYVAIVGDSYDIDNAMQILGGELREQIVSSGATLIFRPDSGIPSEMVLHVITTLIEIFGADVNSKGYAVLPSYIRVIQGDGVNFDSIRGILEILKSHKISADNINFGEGSALLQESKRDDGEWASKLCEATVSGVAVDVYKQPKTDMNKNSKRGAQMLYQRENGDYFTARSRKSNNWARSGVDVDVSNCREALIPTFANGHMLELTTFDKIRTNANFDMDILSTPRIFIKGAAR